MKTDNGLLIVNDWRDDLIWCPSQCYLNFIKDGRFFVLYLRWRHDDPWGVYIIECPDSGFNIHSNQFEWVYEDCKFGRDDGLDEVKQEAIDLFIKWYNQQQK